MPLSQRSATRFTAMVMPTLSKESASISAAAFASSAAGSVSDNSTAMPAGCTKVASWRKSTVSLPMARARSPVPMVTSRTGGWAAPSRDALDASVTCGQSDSDTFFWARAMAKARHVGSLQSLQFVLGRYL